MHFAVALLCRFALEFHRALKNKIKNGSEVVEATGNDEFGQMKGKIVKAAYFGTGEWSSSRVNEPMALKIAF